MDLDGRRGKRRWAGQAATESAGDLRIFLGRRNTRHGLVEVDGEEMQTPIQTGADVLAGRSVRAVGFIRAWAIHARVRRCVFVPDIRKSMRHADAEEQHHRQHRHRNECGPYAHVISLACAEQSRKCTNGAQGWLSSGQFPPAVSA